MTVIVEQIREQYQHGYRLSTNSSGRTAEVLRAYTNQWCVFFFCTGRQWCLGFDAGYLDKDTAMQQGREYVETGKLPEPPVKGIKPYLCS